MTQNNEVAQTAGGGQLQQAPPKEVSPVSIFMKNLPKYEENIAKLLKSKGMRAEEFMVTVETAVKKNPALASCDAKSLFGSILTGAELGLPLNTPQGFAHLIPFKRNVKGPDGQWRQVNEVQFIIGYQGFREIALRNPNILDISSNIVFEKDEFDYNITDAGLTYKHKPYMGLEGKGKRVCAYATARIKDEVTGEIRTKTVVVSASDVELIKKLATGANSESSPWKTEDKDPFGWMWRKVAIKQLCKELPKLYKDPAVLESLAKAVDLDSKAEAGATVIANEDGSTTTILPVDMNVSATEKQNIEDTFAEEVESVPVQEEPKKSAMVPNPAEFEAEAMAAKAEAKAKKGGSGQQEAKF